ncbi:MAG: hypothetical protein SF029_06065 [bacterium]|nr:hypothetical protein [bacterium]
MTHIFSLLRKALLYLWRRFKWTLGLLLFVLVVQRSTYPLHLTWNAVSVMVDDYYFDYLGWEVNAILTKAGQVLWGAQPYMSEADRSQYVRDYMTDLARARQLEAQVNAIYTDPAISNPEAASAEVRAARDAFRADLDNRQPLMEAILEGQVASVLVNEGFGLLGQLVPPISMHFTQVPNLLIVSPRDQIRFDVSINLDPMPIDEIAALEAQIDERQNVASLIVPLGGIALYPAMILETDNLAWAVETFAHEWVHHYFFMYPLGLSYDFTGEARIINETVADLFGKEIAQQVMAHYYPELLAQVQTIPVSVQSQETPAFDFGREMNETRVKVDRYMAIIQRVENKRALAEAAGAATQEAYYAARKEALIEAAEAYMEMRRQVFYDNGHRIRKLNQAYFAFYGGYQGGIAGIGGEDPIGPAVRDLRAMSDSIHEWIVIMRGITSREELVRVWNAMEAEQDELEENF